MTDEARLKTLERAMESIVPWREVLPGSDMTAYVQKTPANYLRRFYMFPIASITVPKKIDDVSAFVQARFVNVLAACYKAQLTVMTAISGNSGNVQIYLGFLSDQDKDPLVYQRIVEGVFPGCGMGSPKSVDFERALKEKRFGGTVSGIPTLKVGEEKQSFRIAPVVRSMYGQDYWLLMISRPVEHSELIRQFNGLLEIRDDCHRLATETVAEEKGEAKTEQTSGSSETFSLIFLSWNWPGKVKGTQEQWSKSLTREQQNGVALELEKMASTHIDRLKKGFNVGFWETTVTFACSSEAGRDILGGSFLGELSRPSVENFPAFLNFAPIQEDQLLLLPTQDHSEAVFPKTLASYITSEELSLFTAPPGESLPGYDVLQMPQFRLTDLIDPADGSSAMGFELGAIADHGKSVQGSKFRLSQAELLKHTFVCGITGSGKTTTVKHILKHVGTSFLVLESAKRDYRRLLGDPVLAESLKVFTVGDSTVAPLRLNPFYVQPGVLPLCHIDYLKAIFNASFSLYGPMPHILERCLHNIYIKRGWNLTRGTHPFLTDDKGRMHEPLYQDPAYYYCFPNIDDLKEEVDDYVKNYLDYRGELSDNIRTAIMARLDSLTVGAKGLMFNTREFLNLDELLSNPAVFEMESLSDDDDKAFFVGLMLVLISEFRQTKDPLLDPFSPESASLKHVLVIEEAHRLLKNVETERTTEMLGNPKGKAVETFCNVVAEMRSLGQGIIVVEQIPTKIAPDVIKNTNTKIVHRLVGRDDQSVLASSLNITDDDALYLGSLKTGYALCHKEGMDRPVEVRLVSDVKEVKIANDRISRLMTEKHRLSLDISSDLHEIANISGKKGTAISLRLLNSILTSSSDAAEQLLQRAEKDLRQFWSLISHPDTFPQSTR